MVASPGQVAACSLLLFAIPVSAKTATTDVELDTWLSNTGPLTTTFTPAPSCFTERRTKIEYKGAYPDLEVGCEGPGGNECCPDRWASGRYFSPGMCPSGYQACTLPTTRQRQETTNMCCPKNYDCPTRADFGLCTSSLNTLLSVVFTDFNSEVRTRTWYDVKASPIQIRFQATDSDVVPIPTDSFNLPPPPTPEELEREREEQRNAEQGGGLSSGEKAGIGVGVTLGVIFAMAATCGLCKRRRTKAHPSETIPLDNTSSERVNGSEAAPPPYTK